MKFRKRPVVVEAERFDEGFVARYYGTAHNTGIKFWNGAAYATIQTLEGAMIARPGDWIVTGINGERYPVKPDIFEAIYEPVE